MVGEDFQICDRDLSHEALAQFMDATAIAVDTETMGLLVHRDRLCLVQLCDNRGRVAVVRIAKGQTDAPNLKQLLEADIEKIFHFSRMVTIRASSRGRCRSEPPL